MSSTGVWTSSTGIPTFLAVPVVAWRILAYRTPDSLVIISEGLGLGLQGPDGAYNLAYALIPVGMLVALIRRANFSLSESKKIT